MANRRLSDYLFLSATVLTAVFTLCLGIYEYQREHAFRVDILRQIQEETAEDFRSKNIQVRMNIPSSIPMRGDASLIYSMFRNIFNNTLAYASEATYFEVQANTSGSKQVYTFIDNGVGVPAEHLPHIFERFYRIDKGRSRQLGGTGLGLAIVKNIAVQYGGSASASTTPGGGLTVTIEINI